MSDDSADFDLDPAPERKAAPVELPPPPVPSNADLRGFRRMPLDVIALLGSEFWAIASDAEKVAGLSLWCEAWHQQPAGSLPDHERALAKFSGRGTVQAFNRVRAVAMRGWYKASDGRLYHPFLSSVVQATLETQTARSKGGRHKQALKNAQSGASSTSSSSSTQEGAQAVQGSGKERITPLRSLDLDPEALAAFRAAKFFVVQDRDGSWRPCHPHEQRTHASTFGPIPGQPNAAFSLAQAADGLKALGFSLVEGLAVRINGRADHA